MEASPSPPQSISRVLPKVLLICGIGRKSSVFCITYILGWDAPSVGLKFEILPVFSLIIGLICYCIFVLILNLLRISKIVENDAYLVSVRLIPRQKLQKMLFLIAVCVLNPITDYYFSKRFLALVLNGSLQIFKNAFSAIAER